MGGEGCRMKIMDYKKVSQRPERRGSEKGQSDLEKLDQKGGGYGA